MSITLKMRDQLTVDNRPQRISEVDRDHTVRHLSDALAAGYMSYDEHDQRAQAAVNAVYAQDLQKLLEDLPQDLQLDFSSFSRAGALPHPVEPEVKPVEVAKSSVPAPATVDPEQLLFAVVAMLFAIIVAPGVAWILFSWIF